MTELELKIKGMTCGHCEMRVKKALEAVKGVKSAAPDHAKGVAKLNLSGDVDSAKLAEAVADVGYEVV